MCLIQVEKRMKSKLKREGIHNVYRLDIAQVAGDECAESISGVRILRMCNTRECR